MIGGGVSGKDIVERLSKTASRVTLSRRKRPIGIQLERLHEQLTYSNITIQDIVVKFSSTGATFIDGSYQTFDAVILATGIFICNSLIIVLFKILISKTI